MDDSLRNTLVVIQARMGSSRLPGKTLMPLASSTLLGVLVQRIRCLPFPIVVATSVNSEDDKIETYSRELGVSVFRGDAQNVQSRFTALIDSERPANLIRLTADNPLVDGTRILETIDLLKSNWTSRSYFIPHSPKGLGFEIFASSLLKEAAAPHLASVDSQEHVTTLIRSKILRDVMIHADPFGNNSFHESLSFTIDTIEDYHQVLKLVDSIKVDSLTHEEIVQVTTDFLGL